MKLIGPIVNHINSTLASGKLNGVIWQSARWSGLCTSSAGVDEDGKVVYHVHENGNDVTPDDTYPANIYHRCTSIQFAVKNTQFGQTEDFIIAKYAMKLIVFADAKKLTMEPNDLALFVYAGIPSRISRDDIGIDGVLRCSIQATSADTDAAKVFQGEFGAKYPAQMFESTLIAVNYSVEIEVDKSCLDCQDCI